jgi:hypothetical protein
MTPASASPSTSMALPARINPFASPTQPSTLPTATVGLQEAEPQIPVAASTSQPNPRRKRKKTLDLTDEIFSADIEDAKLKRRKEEKGMPSGGNTDSAQQVSTAAISLSDAVRPVGQTVQVHVEPTDSVGTAEGLHEVEMLESQRGDPAMGHTTPRPLPLTSSSEVEVLDPEFGMAGIHDDILSENPPQVRATSIRASLCLKNVFYSSPPLMYEWLPQT